MNKTISHFTDFLWGKIFPESYKIQNLSFERFAVDYENYFFAIKDVYHKLNLEVFNNYIRLPFNGEPISIGYMLRKYDYIKYIEISPNLNLSTELFQRIYETVYPIRVLSFGESQKLLKTDKAFRLLSPHEIDKLKECEILDSNPGVILASCY